MEIPVVRLDDAPCFFFLCCLREDSLPLASERLGEPGRLREEDETVRERGSGCLPGRLEGVFVPREEEPDEGGGFVLSAALDFLSSSSFLSRSSSSRSASESESS